jgi:hypothetical protein
MFVSPSAANARSSLRQADEFCVTIAQGKSRNYSDLIRDEARHILTGSTGNVAVSHLAMRTSITIIVENLLLEQRAAATPRAPAACEHTYKAPALSPPEPRVRRRLAKRRRPPIFGKRKAKTEKYHPTDRVISKER